MIQVEVTNRCNLSCTFCSRAVTDMSLGDLDEELIKKVVELSATAQETALFGYGEPLISKAFYRLLPLLRSAAIGFFTNGLLLTPKLLTKVAGLAQRPLKYIVFSIDGASPAVYESIRAGSDFKRVWKNLEDAVATRERAGWKGPEFNIEFVAMAVNIRELPDLVRLADEAGVDHLKVSHLVVWDESLRDQSLFYHQDLLRQVFPEAAAAAEGRRLKLDLPKFLGLPRPKEAPIPPCRYPWHYVMISYEGDVRACCFAPQFTFGNLRRNSFREIWDNASYRRLRATLNGPDCPPPCARCEERYRLAPSPDDEATYIKLKPRDK